MEGCKCKPAKSYAERIIEYQEFISLVKRMRDTQQNIEMMERFAYQWTVDDRFKYDNLLQDKAKQESDVDEYLKKMEV